MRNLIAPRLLGHPGGLFVGIGLAMLTTAVFVIAYPLKEEDLHKGEPQRTNFAYAVAKRALAVQIDSSNQQYGTKYNYLIPCNLYGEYDQLYGDRHYLKAVLGTNYEQSSFERLQVQRVFDLCATIEAARAAFPPWRGLSPLARKGYLQAALGAMIARRDEIASIDF